MILGVDHIALSCNDIVSCGMMMSEAGLKEKFIHDQLSNPLAKKPFMQTYSPSHGLVYYQAEGETSVELTDHFRPLSLSLSPYQVLLNSSMPYSDSLPESLRSDLRGLEKVWLAAAGCSVRAGLWKPFNAQYWYPLETGSKGKAFIKAVLLNVTDLSTAQRFWEAGLGGGLVNAGLIDGMQWARLRLRSFLPSGTLDLILCENKKVQPLFYLEDSGFPCLTFLSHRLEDDSNRLMKEGASLSGDLFSLEVNQKWLNIKILRGPNNELIELIEIQQTLSKETVRGV